MLHTKIISGILSFIMFVSSVGLSGGKTNETPNEVKTVTVAADGSGDYNTLDAARDYVRTLDRSQFCGIDIVVKAGEYHLDKAFMLTEEDGGTKTCPVRYIGEEGTVIGGGLAFTKDDFSPVTDLTGTAQWFKADAADNIVSLDLTKYGYSADFMKELYANPKTIDLNRKIPTVYSDGEKLTIARFPNDEYAATGKDSYIEGGEVTAKDLETPMFINYDEKYDETVRSWHDIDKVFTDSRFSYTWVNENSRIIELDPDNCTMKMLFTGGHDPREGTPFFWYNIPEELDAPGEYYIDEDSVLYLCKPENFDTAMITIPKTEYAIDVSDADYVTLEDLLIESFFTRAVTVNADNFTMRGCTVRSIVGKAAYISGCNNTIDGNDFYTIGTDAIEIDGGDHAELISCGSTVTNNVIHDWGQVKEQYSYGLTLSGVGILASHNELYNCPHIAVYFGGQNNIFEYGYVHDVLLHADDVGAFASGGHYSSMGNTVRYCYIKNVGPTDPAFMVDKINNYPACGSNVFYWDFQGSGQTTYGNVIEHVYGAAYHSEGKFNTVTNTVIIGCAKYTFQVFDTSYREHLDWDRSLDGWYNAKPEFITDAWEKAFPGLDGLEWGNTEVVGDGNPNYAGAPIGIVIKDNVVYYDKGYTWKSTAMKNPYQFDRFAAELSELVDDGFTLVNSKRDPYDIDEIVKENEKLLGMTYEQFKSCGAVR